MAYMGPLVVFLRQYRSLYGFLSFGSSSLGRVQYSTDLTKPFCYLLGSSESRTLMI